MLRKKKLHFHSVVSTIKRGSPVVSSRDQRQLRRQFANAHSMSISAMFRPSPLPPLRDVFSFQLCIGPRMRNSCCVLRGHRTPTYSVNRLHLLCSGHRGASKHCRCRRAEDKLHVTSVILSRSHCIMLEIEANSFSSCRLSCFIHFFENPGIKTGGVSLRVCARETILDHSLL